MTRTTPLRRALETVVVGVMLLTAEAGLAKAQGSTGAPPAPSTTTIQSPAAGQTPAVVSSSATAPASKPAAPSISSSTVASTPQAAAPSVSSTTASSAQPAAVPPVAVSTSAVAPALPAAKTDGMLQRLIEAQEAGAQQPPAEAPEGVQISPIYSLQILGGQNFYTSETPNLSANAKGVVAPAVKFNDNWSLLPSFETDYVGTRQVLDLVGGGTLFESQWDNKLTVKGIYTPDDSLWRLKPYTSFQYELLQQTNDEQLGNGLYDYYQWEVGADAEYVWHDPYTVGFGIDYYQVHFPNYTSLESQVATQVGGQSLARELVGNYVLDTQNVLVSANASAPVGGDVSLELTAAGLYENFPNQHVVDASGNLVSSLRKDVVSIFGAGLRLPHKWSDTVRGLTLLDLGYTYDSSTQNSFDASQTEFIPHFYNYGEFKLNPGFTLLIGSEKRPIEFDLSGYWWWRRYPYRLIQDSIGTYQGKGLWTNNWMTSLALNYPITEHFKLVFDFQYGQAISNQGYLALYQYNYTTATYMAGFSYDY